jgi:uncharacterized protein
VEGFFMAEFEIKVTELDAGSREYDFPIRAAWLAETMAALAPEEHAVADTDGALHVIAEKSGADVLVRGTAEATLYVPCGRCLEPACVRCHSDITVLLSRRGDTIRPPGADDDTDTSPTDEPEVEVFSGDEIRLDDLVREHLVLEIPMQPLCRPDCPGIAVPESIKGPKHLEAHPSAPDLDPRLAPLLALSKDKKASS